jgi:hypothetical protein
MGYLAMDGRGRCMHRARVAGRAVQRNGAAHVDVVTALVRWKAAQSARWRGA